SMALSVIEQSKANRRPTFSYLPNTAMVLSIAQEKADGLMDNDQTDHDSSQTRRTARGRTTGNHGEPQEQCDGKISSQRREIPYVLRRPWRRRDSEQRQAEIEGYRRFQHEETDETEKNQDSQKQLAATNDRGWNKLWQPGFCPVQLPMPVDVRRSYR